jgi:hypothetical protein
MTWTHNIIGTENTNDQLRILIDYTDENENVFHDSLYVANSSLNLEWLKQQITSKLNQLNYVSSFNVPTGTIDLTPTVVALSIPKVSEVQSTVAAGSSSDTVYIVTTGKQLTVSYFTGGGATGSQKIELFYDPNGNGLDMTLIDVIYCNGSSDKFEENFTSGTGNGTIAVRIRQTNYSASATESFGKWEGSEI